MFADIDLPSVYSLFSGCSHGKVCPEPAVAFVTKKGYDYGYGYGFIRSESAARSSRSLGLLVPCAWLRRRWCVVRGGGRGSARDRAPPQHHAPPHPPLVKRSRRLQCSSSDDRLNWLRNDTSPTIPADLPPELRTAAHGGLQPLPAGRLRRAILHLSHSAESSGVTSVMTSRLCFRSWHTGALDSSAGRPTAS